MCLRFKYPTCLVLLTVILLEACQSPNDLSPTVPVVTQASQPTATKPSGVGQAQIVAMIDVSSPSSMTVGNGVLWVVSGGSIVRIDPNTNQVVGEAISASVRPEEIAFGEDELWVTTVASGDLNAPSDTDAVSRLDPETGEVLSTVNVPRGPMSLAFTPEGVWVVNFGQNADTVIRIDPQTNEVSGDPIQTGRGPLSIAVGDGSVWVANHDARSVTRIDPGTNQVVANITIPEEPHRLAFGEGAVWVANWHTNSVTRIDPQTNQILGEPIPIGFHAGNITAGLGSVWVTSDYRSPVDADPQDVVLVRIDPQANQAVETIPLGGHPIDVEIAGNAVWVSIQGPNKVLRVNP